MTDAPHTNSGIKIQVTDLHKRFGEKKVLKGVNLDVLAGKSTVVIGGSGSGKSVLIKNIIGLMKPEKGSIAIDGEEVTKFSRSERDKLMSKFGMLFQGGALFDSLTVWENVSFALMHNQKMSRKDAIDLAVDKLNAVGMDADVAKLHPSELSGGMQKRVALARAIADDPEIIFFDEPTTGLDPIMANVINDLIVKTSKELGATTLSITHDMDSVRHIADEVAMIFEGEILWSGSVEEMEETDNPHVHQFVRGDIKGPIKMQLKK